jgi:uncharacterized repeat protein (TIGR03803 family)
MNRNLARRSNGAAIGVAVLFLFVTLMPISSSAQTYAPVYELQASAVAPYEPGGPAGLLVQGADGNLYGASFTGGQYTGTGYENGGGTVYEMDLSTGLPTVLASFFPGDNCGTGLILATNGSFYGACQGGFPKGGTNNPGYIYQLTQQPNLTWVLTKLYSFCSQANCTDGEYPASRPVQGGDGNLYGATTQGGASGYGEVYQLTLGGQLNVLHSFTDDPNLSYPDGVLELGNNGDLYGTTQGSTTESPTCPPNCGAVYEIHYSGSLNVLHEFAGGKNDGATPTRGVIQAANGSLYGTTVQGGENNAGTIFRVGINDPASSLPPFEILYSFPETPDIGVPRRLEQASDYNFYGIANCSTLQECYGTLFGIAPAGGSLILNSAFTDLQGDQLGAHPDSALSHTSGTLYGVTTQGGIGNSNPPQYGVLYSLQIAGAPQYCRPQFQFGPQGMPLQILGQGFDESTEVYFYENAQATPTSWTGTSLEINVPASAKTGPLMVKTGSQTLRTIGLFYVQPTGSSFQPSAGPKGTSVTIQGTALSQTTKVTFGGIAARYTVNSDTELKVSVPAGAKSGAIEVTTEGGKTKLGQRFRVTR